MFVTRRLPFRHFAPLDVSPSGRIPRFLLIQLKPKHKKQNVSGRDVQGELTNGWNAHKSSCYYTLKIDIYLLTYLQSELSKSRPTVDICLNALIK